MLQVRVHVPIAHTALPLVLLQPLPQAPQLFGSLARGVSQPLPGFLSQSPKPLTHVPAVQSEFTQAAVAFGSGGQTLPQWPQLTRSWLASVSQPSFVS